MLVTVGAVSDSGFRKNIHGELTNICRFVLTITKTAQSVYEGFPIPSNQSKP